MSSINYIGEVAHACINRHHNGVIDSVFERSTYLLFHDMYLCIALSSVGRGPVNIVYSENEQVLHDALRPSAAVRFCPIDNTLCINGTEIAQLTTARICHSAITPIPLNTDRLSAHRRCLASLAFPSSGLFSLVAESANSALANSSLYHNHSSLQPYTSIDQALRQFALPIQRDLINWLELSIACDDATLLEPPGSVCNFLGAGPGLTPSGDDLLAGVLLALQTAGFTHISAKLWEQLQPVLTSRTNKISAALLQQAAQGRAGEYALAALAMYASAEHLDVKVLSRQLDRIGDTSGWDFLAGVILVFDVVTASIGGSDYLADWPLARRS